jgi:hypothetical protein
MLEWDGFQKPTDDDGLATQSGDVILGTARRRDQLGTDDILVRADRLARFCVQR